MHTELVPAIFNIACDIKWLRLGLVVSLPVRALVSTLWDKPVQRECKLKLALVFGERLLNQKAARRPR